MGYIEVPQVMLVGHNLCWQQDKESSPVPGPDASSLELFKSRQDGVLSNLTQWKRPTCQGCWNCMNFKVSSKSNHSMIQKQLGQETLTDLSSGDFMGFSTGVFRRYTITKPKINPQIQTEVIQERKSSVTWTRSLRLFGQRNEVLKN